MTSILLFCKIVNSMQEVIKKEQRQNALFLKAVSNPVRIYILEEIGRNKICVCDLASKLNMSFAAISKHFSVLKNAGLVYEERDKNNIFYRVSCDCVFDLIKKAKDVLSCVKDKKLL